MKNRPAACAKMDNDYWLGSSGTKGWREEQHRPGVL
jgi:hypothetical protein